MVMPHFALMVAYSNNGGIGMNGKIPWHIPADMKHFQMVTTTTQNPAKTNAIIMGRKTWESLPTKPLSKRRNIVLSRSTTDRPGVEVYDSLDTALTVLGRESEVERIFVIGGEQIYKEALAHPNCRYAYVTIIGEDYECDAHFPSSEFFKPDWYPVWNSPVLRTIDGITYIFCEYEKRTII